ncbi:MAG TPA: S41 family peptidase [Puia sp.]|nr:S41 family peptidase [Puia sp.]
MARSRLLFSCLFLLSHAMAAPTQSIHPDTLALPCRQKAEQLLDEALHFMEKNYYRRDRVSWTALEAQARQQLLNAGNCDDAYASITWCFQQLGERHSFIMPPDKAARYTGDDAPGGQISLTDLVGEIRGEWLQDSIGYLTIPWVSSTDSLVCERIADSIQAVIARLDTHHLSHWIIDLRNNSGGNCWPMLAGIGPLLGDGVYGYFVASGERIPIAYYDGSACQGRHVICRVSENHGYHTHSTRKSIVVLTGHRTVSAGEIVALAFKGRQQTCLIGQPTAGLTTANATYSLSDRSMLVLTVCQEADFTGHICDGRIQPDQLIPAADVNTDADPARSAALAWLENK